MQTKDAAKLPTTRGTEPTTTEDYPAAVAIVLRLRDPGPEHKEGVRGLGRLHMLDLRKSEQRRLRKRRGPRRKQHSGSVAYSGGLEYTGFQEGRGGHPCGVMLRPESTASGGHSPLGSSCPEMSFSDGETEHWRGDPRIWDYRARGGRAGGSLCFHGGWGLIYPGHQVVQPGSDGTVWVVA